MTDKEFLQQQMAAVERMREMNSRSAFQGSPPHRMPPVPSFVRVPENETNRGRGPADRQANNRSPQRDTAPDKNIPKNQIEQRKQPSQTSGGFPLFDKILTDSDSTLIIGLLLLLMSENADKKLLFALVYILL